MSSVLSMAKAHFSEIASLDPKIGSPLWESARDAHGRGLTIWTCMVVVAAYAGAAIKVTHGVTKTNRVSADELINAIEKLGWRLEYVSHVYVQTTTTTNPGFAGVSVAGVGGQVEAYYTFRRAGS